MAERIVSMHAAYRSGKEVVDGFLPRPSAGGARAIVLVHGYRGLDAGRRAVTRRFAQEGFVCLSHALEDCALKKTSLDIPSALRAIADSVAYLRKRLWVRGKRRRRAGILHGRRTCSLRLGSIQSIRCRGLLLPEPVSGPRGSKNHLRAHALPLRTEDPGTSKTEIDMFRESLDRYKKKYEIEMY